ncbi:MAG: tetratricopeptide repeat protein [Sandaracinaceae bacterium]|nr:tetratricopeptide repeat protein [Sandaracinaceae bacterium]
MKSLALVVALATFFVALPALADDPRARALLNRGASLRERGREQDALDAFLHANAIESTPRTIAQIGLTHGALGHWVEAYVHLRQAMAATDDPWIRSRWSALEAAMIDVRAHVAFLHVSGEREGVHVVIGTRDLGAIPIADPVAVDPGTVDVEIRRDDTVLYTQRVMLQVGETSEVVIRPEEEPSTRPRTPTQPQPPAEPRTAIDPPARAGRPWPAIGWTSIGVGSAAIITGIVFHIMREHEAGLANDCRLTPAMCMGTAEEHIDAANTDRTVAIVSYAVGGALVAGGILALVFAGNRTASVTSSALGCGPSLNGLGAFCAGTF